MSHKLLTTASSTKFLSAMLAIICSSMPDRGIAQQATAPANELQVESNSVTTKDTVVADPMTLKGELRDRLLSNRSGSSQEIAATKELPPVPNIALQAIVVGDDGRGHAFIKVDGSKQGILLRLPPKALSEVGPTLTIAGRTLTLSRWSRRYLVFQTQLGETIFAR